MPRAPFAARSLRISPWPPGVALVWRFEPVAVPWVIRRRRSPYWSSATAVLPVRRAWLPSLLFGIGFQFTLLVWMRSVGTDAYIVLSLLECAFFAPLGMLLALVGRLPGWPIWSAAAWVAVEEWRSGWPFGRYAVGAAGVRLDRHPTGELAAVRRHAPGQPALGAPRHDAGLGAYQRSSPSGALARTGRRGRQRCGLLPTLVPYSLADLARSRWPPFKATFRGWHGRPLRPSAGHCESC